MRPAVGNPSRLLSLCAAALAAWLSLPASSLAAPTTFPDRVTVTKEGDEEAVFDQIQDELVRAKVGQGVARQALDGFDRYIDKAVEREKKAVTIHPRVIFEIAKAAAQKGWSGSDISAVLVRIQAEIDGAGRAAEELAKAAADEIAKGSGRRAVIAALEASRSTR